MEAAIKEFLAQAGITINGDQPYDIHIHEKKALLSAISKNRSLAAGEGFMKNHWDCHAVDELFFRLARFCNIDKIRGKKMLLWFVIKNTLFNLQSKSRSKYVADIHYNLDNTMYQRMLGPTMAYTCGYWKNAHTLDEAQEAKYQLVCDKLNLSSNDRLLDLGCGWGGFSKYAAARYGCEVVAVNIATEQVQFAKEQCKDLPVTFYTTDYRNDDIYNPNNTPFTKIATIGLCEHIGRKNYAEYINIMNKQLDDNGLILLHTIGKRDHHQITDPWINKYIFPGGLIPALSQLTTAIEGKMVIEDIHNFGNDYDTTLMAWDHNFTQGWDDIKDQFSDTFYRMWRYYLLTCAGVFRARELQLWQIVLSPKGVLSGYESIR